MIEKIKEKKWFVLVFLVCLFTVKDLLRPGIYYAHDVRAHLTRIYQFHLALTNGQFPVRWAPTLLKGLGYPLFVVNYQLPLYFAELLNLLGFGVIGAYKATLLLTFLFSVFSSYLFFKKLWGETAGLVGASVFSLAPWRYANIFTRGALGGTFVYALLPLNMYALVKIEERDGLFFFTLVTAMLVTSHAVVALVFMPAFFLIWLLHVRKNVRAFKRLILGTVLAALLSAFFWMPAIFERGYLKFDTVVEEAFLGHFLPLAQVFRIPLRGINIGTTLQLGITHTLLAFISLITGLIFLLKSKKREAGVIFAYLLLFFFSIFILSRFSLPLWEKTGILIRTVWLPWRFLGVAVFAVASLSAFSVSKLKRGRNLMIMVLLLLLLYPYRHYFGPTEGWLEVQEEFYTKNQETGTSDREFDPIWLEEQAFEELKPEIKITPPATIIELIKRPTVWRFKVKTQEPSEVRLALLYFPGWQVKSNGQTIKIEQKHGLINFSLPPSEQEVRVEFGETGLRKTADIISLLSLLGLIVFKKKLV